MAKTFDPTIFQKKIDIQKILVEKMNFFVKNKQ
jgi:hypothetical protein